MVPRVLSRSIPAVAGVAALALLGEVLDALGALPGPSPHRFFEVYVYLGLLVLGALVCVWRAAAVRPERLAWSAMAVALVVWATADVTVQVVWNNNPPFPSVADGLYLAYYPFAYVALVLLVRSRFRRVEVGVWLDGIVVGLALAAVAAALVFEPIVHATSGSTATVATTLAYPVGDMVLLVFIAAIFTATGFRPGKPLAMIGGGLLLTAVADSAYTYLASTSTYHPGSLLDSAWPAGMLLIGFAGWVRGRQRTAVRAETMPIFVASVVCALVAVGLLVVDHYHRLTPVALFLAFGAIVTGVLRAALSFVGRIRALRRAEQEALTDGLTGLGNRRLLMNDLDHALAAGHESGARTLVFFDLDGFKHYNDAFGHPAGDALLARLGHRLEAAAQGRGRAYRLGGDEFCLLFDRDVARDAQLLAATSAALSESGDGFSIACSSGLVAMPREAPTPAEALHLADIRMYAQKGAGRTSAAHQARDVLLQTLREQEPALHEHLTGVAEHAVVVARRLGLAPAAVDEAGRAAQLHDIGKIALPAEILHKPGPLSDEEWRYMRQHTVIGERILAAAPSLAPVASLVRASHERYDGTGYPDGLRGEEIPLGARIVGLCDAYDAMVSDRPYSAALSHDEAVAELKRCSGGQFDPLVVEAFAESFCEQNEGARFELDPVAAG